MGSACGQAGSTHETALALSGGVSEADLSSPAGQPIPANGENSGPVAGVRYRVFRVVVTEQKTVKGYPKGQGPLQVCPIRGSGFFSDDFGAPRFSGGYHPHAGNDMFAETGTPIVAPFDGVAVATPNELGGLAVKIFGAAGYVYNAHLISYGKLGTVKTGDVVGYVGDTGNARGGPPHNHFEFHPRNGSAVNPYPYLVTACVAPGS